MHDSSLGGRANRAWGVQLSDWGARSREYWSWWGVDVNCLLGVTTVVVVVVLMPLVLVWAFEAMASLRKKFSPPVPGVCRLLYRWSFCAGFVQECLKARFLPSQVVGRVGADAWASYSLLTVPWSGSKEAQPKLAVP